MYDLIIRNGLIFDGSGGPGYRGDVAIQGDKIESVGNVVGGARAEIDAQGQVVSPGFIDIHTHYDVQLLWDGLATPSLEHGVTSIVTGNCSLTLAPLREKDRDWLVRMFREIEELPQGAFDEGVNWAWETFAEYLQALQGKLGVNVAPLVGHSLLRMWVMGEDLYTREATPAEVDEMADLLVACLQAGATGFSTSFIDFDEKRRPVPSRFANFDELRTLARAMGQHGGGVLQFVVEFWDTDLFLSRVDLFADLALECGVTVTVQPTFFLKRVPETTLKVVARVEEWAAQGARIWPQVTPRPFDIYFSLSEPKGNTALNTMPSWSETLLLPDEEKLDRYRDPTWRSKFIAAIEEQETGATMQLLSGANIGTIVVAEVGNPEYAGLVGQSLDELARDRKCHPIEAMIDVAIDDNLKTRFRGEGLGHADTAIVGDLLSSPFTLVGASDAGAHIQGHSTNGDTGYFFSKFVRELKALPLEQAVRRLTFDLARAWNLQGRGLLANGYFADLVIFDREVIDQAPVQAVEDIPGGGFRLVRSAKGVKTVIVNGQTVYDAETGYSPNRPGRFLSYGGRAELSEVAR
jgi:N-acyl-D-amino-acid deacylase